MANLRRLIGVFVVLIVVAAGGFFGWKKVEAINAKKGDSTQTAQGKPTAIPRPDSAGPTFDAGTAIPVVGAEVKRGPLIIWVTAQGAASSSHQVTVGGEASGRIDRVYAKENDVIRAGDTLVMLDTTELVFALKQAQISLNRAEIQLKNQLISDYHITDPQIRKERETNARMSSGLVDAQLNLDRARMEYAKAATRSPIGGKVANLKVVPGQRIGSGAELMTIAQMDPIRVQTEGPKSCKPTSASSKWEIRPASPLLRTATRFTRVRSNRLILS
jgi:membrane fusion protein, multidrug efflux system